MIVCCLTLLRKSRLLVRLKGLGAVLLLDRRIAPTLRKLDSHRLVVQIEALKHLHGLGGLIGGVVDDEGLAAGLEVLLGDDVDDLAELAEDLLQAVDERWDLDLLVEVLDVETRAETCQCSCRAQTPVRTECNVRTLRWVAVRRQPC